jgi:hypothetical protein
MPPVPKQIFLPARRPHPKWKWPPGSVVLGQSPSGADVQVDERTLSTHMHLIGASGFGKSKLLEGIARQAILALDGKPRGLVLIDPHGTVIRDILCWIATFGIDKYRRVHLIDPTSDDIVGINPLRLRPGIDPAYIAQTVKNAVMEVWDDQGAMPQLEESLLAIFYTIATLGWTLLESELLADIADPMGVRQFIIENVRHPQIRRFWATLDALPAAKIEEKLGSAVRRLNSFLLPQALRRMFSRRERVIDFRAAMDAGDIVLIDLSYGNGRISEDESSLLGRLILSDIFLSTLGRREGAPEVLLIIDECQRYLIQVIANILDQARKFGLSMVLAHQHLGHLREAGEHIFRSVMTNARTKIVFGGLDDDDATLMARNLFRGVLNLETPKTSFDRATVVGQEYDWLASQSQGRGTARAEGTNWSHSESTAHSQSTTTSWGRTLSDSDTASQSRTRSEATTRSKSKTRSRSASDQWSHTDQSSTGTSSSDTGSSSGSQSFSVNQAYHPHASTGTRLRSPEAGATVADGFTDTAGTATSTGRSSSSGAADTYGGASARGEATTRGTATTHGTADTLGTAHTHGVALTEGIAFTEGTTHSTSSSRGGSVTDTASRSDTTGRAQTLRSIYATLPTQAYSLQELQYLGSSLLGSLAIGEAIAKIGNRPPVRLKTLRIKPGWASEAQVDRLKERLALASPFVTPLPEARARYIAHRQAVMQQLLGAVPPPQLAPIAPNAEPITARIKDEPQPMSPPLKDEGWG